MQEQTRECVLQVQACSQRLVEFWGANPQSWLAYADSQFRRTGIKDVLTKLDVIVEKLPTPLLI